MYLPTEFILIDVKNASCWTQHVFTQWVTIIYYLAHGIQQLIPKLWFFSLPKQFLPKKQPDQSKEQVSWKCRCIKIRKLLQKRFNSTIIQYILTWLQLWSIIFEYTKLGWFFCKNWLGSNFIKWRNMEVTKIRPIFKRKLFSKKSRQFLT